MISPPTRIEAVELGSRNGDRGGTTDRNFRVQWARYGLSSIRVRHQIDQSGLVVEVLTE